MSILTAFESISRTTVINRENSIVVTGQTHHFLALTEQATTMIAGEKAVNVASFVSILGVSITGMSFALVSGTIECVDKAHIYFGSKV